MLIYFCIKINIEHIILYSHFRAVADKIQQSGQTFTRYLCSGGGRYEKFEGLSIVVTSAVGKAHSEYAKYALILGESRSMPLPPRILKNKCYEIESPIILITVMLNSLYSADY